MSKHTLKMLYKDKKWINVTLKMFLKYIQIFFKCWLFFNIRHERVKSLKFPSEFFRDCSNTAKAEGVARRCSVKNLFLKISQNSQENTCARVSFLIKRHFLIKNTSCGCLWIMVWLIKINADDYCYHNIDWCQCYETNFIVIILVSSNLIGVWIGISFVSWYRAFS